MMVRKVHKAFKAVATVLTACGIETVPYQFMDTTDYRVATVLTACGIETSEIYLI